jgi:hypothetical protein
MHITNRCETVTTMWDNNIVKKTRVVFSDNKVFITENLTTRRRKIMDELNYLRTNRKISACWSMDGRLFASVIGTSRLLLHISSTILSVFILCTFLGSGHGTLWNRRLVRLEYCSWSCGKVQVIARFITYCQRQAVYSSKSKLKNNPNKVFITENLTTRFTCWQKESVTGLH